MGRYYYQEYPLLPSDCHLVLVSRVLHPKILSTVAIFYYGISFYQRVSA